jgi:small subunit ribosomal protein S29
VNSSSTYNYDIRTQVYSQPSFAFETLQRLLGANEPILNSLQTTKEVAVERRAPIKAGTSLTELIRVGMQDQSVAATVLEAVLAELGAQNK